jgi:hypothetical protein
MFYRFCFERILGVGPPGAPGGRRMPAVDFLASSIRPFERLIPGTTHSLQLHCIPCQAYLPTLA